MRSVDSVLLAWEIIEITCVRRALDAAVNAGLSDPDGHWHQAIARAEPLLGEIRRKCFQYHQSVDQLLAKRGLAAARDLDDAIAAARTCRLGDRLVCHVGMARAYSWMAATIALHGIQATGPDDRLDRICEALRDRALVLYDEQAQDWRDTARHCLARGFNLETIHPTPNPFGVDGGPPCWHLTPIGIDLAW